MTDRFLVVPALFLMKDVLVYSLQLFNVQQLMVKTQFKALIRIMLSHTAASTVGTLTEPRPPNKHF